MRPIGLIHHAHACEGSNLLPTGNIPENEITPMRARVQRTQAQSKGL